MHTPKNSEKEVEYIENRHLHQRTRSTSTILGSEMSSDENIGSGEINPVVEI